MLRLCCGVVLQKQIYFKTRISTKNEQKNEQTEEQS